MTVRDLLIEYNETSLEGLIHNISNNIDWYSEMLFDDPWNEYAAIARKRSEKILNFLTELNGSDWDLVEIPEF